MTTMCDVGRQFPGFVAAFLQREGELQRGRFREETLTDMFAAALVPFAGPHLHISFPYEPMTGGDIDLHYVNLGTGRAFDVRLQAKRLSPSTKAGRVVKWDRREYAELLHKSGKGKIHQYKTLAATTAPTVPLYMFYNHQDAVDHASRLGGWPPVAGVNLAFAADIARELDQHNRAPKQLRNRRRLDHLRQWFLPLEFLLCPPSPWRPVPTPEAVRSTLASAWRELNGDQPRDKFPMALSEDMGASTVFDRVDGKPFIRREEVERTRITFVTSDRSEPD